MSPNLIPHLCYFIHKFGYHSSDLLLKKIINTATIKKIKKKWLCIVACRRHHFWLYHHYSYWILHFQGEVPWKLKRFKPCNFHPRCIPIFPSLRKHGPMALSECLVDLRSSLLFRLSCRVQNLPRIYGEGQHLWWLHVRIIMFQVAVK